MRRFFVAGCAALVVLTAVAQRVEVRKSGDGKITINLSSYRTGSDAASRTFLSVLKADLNRSGYFTVTSAGAELNVVGSCAAAGSRLKADCQVYKVSNRQRLLGKSYSAETSADVRAMAHKAADDIVYAVTGKKGMASAKIALVSNRTGRKELYVCDMDGKNLRQYTNDRSIVVGPRWSPSAVWLYTTSSRTSIPASWRRSTSPRNSAGLPVAQYRLAGAKKPRLL